MQWIIITLFLLGSTWAYAEKPGHSINSSIKDFTEKYCVECHNDQKQKGDIRLDKLSSLIDNNATAQLWQDVLDVINTGDMPPKKADQPKVEELSEVIGFLTEDLLKAKKVLTDQGGEIIVRRLNKLEYINSIESLTGIRLPARLVPDDETSDSFNTMGANQYFSPSLIEQYMTLNQMALRKVILETDSKPLQNRKIHNALGERIFKGIKSSLDKRTATYEKALLVVNNNEDFKAHGFTDFIEAKHAVQNQQGITTLQKHYLEHPAAKTGALLMQRAHYTERISMKADFQGKYILRIKIATEDGMPEDRKFLEVTQNDQLIGYYQIHGTLDKPQILEIEVRTDIDAENVNIVVKEKDNGNIPDTTYQGQLTRRILKGEFIPSIWMQWIELEGPFYTDHYKNAKEVVLNGTALKSASDTELRDLFTKFAEKAFRGAPASEEFISQLIDIYNLEIEAKKSPQEAIIKPLAVILSSPSFLFLNERKEIEEKRKLTHRELATRLSYALLKSAPDASLLNAKKSLASDQKFFTQQIEEMMKDPRFQDFNQEFFGQWLHMQKYDQLSFSIKLFPEFDGGLALSARQEVFEFIRTIIDEDLSLTNLIDSDFTLVNSMMAAYYGLPAQTGDEFVKVKLPENMRYRGGLLGKTAIQAMGSTGDRTSPVERGAFILRKFLNSPPPPPPPNVPQLDEKQKNLTVKQMLAKHNEIPQCNSCHKKMDPLGLAMENFDAIGRWRDKDGRSAIDPSGAMPDGTKFANFTEMKQMLMNQKEKMVASLIEALIKYGLGREQEFSDQDFVNGLLAVSRENNYRFKPLLIAFLTSKEFTHK
jgi:hypothetical protein